MVSLGTLHCCDGVRQCCDMEVMLSEWTSPAGSVDMRSYRDSLHCCGGVRQCCDMEVMLSEWTSPAGSVDMRSCRDSLHCCGEAGLGSWSELVLIIS